LTVFDFNQAVHIMLLSGMIFLSITVFLCLIFAISTQKLTDRIVATNMIGIKTTILIVIVAFYLGEGYLIDVSFIYAMIAFVSTVVFAKFVLQFRDKIKAKIDHSLIDITLDKSE